GAAPAAARAAALAAILGLALGLAWIAPRGARAGTEEFSTFHPEGQEEDDESIIDHLLTRTPLAWRDEWERAPLALRTSQGCLTSGQWFMDNELKLETAMGRTARFNLDYTQVAGDISDYEFLDFWFRFRLRAGMIGTMFRPMHDKSKQDMALAWEVGADSTAFQLRAIYGLEDVFNNLWAWRQSRVGNVSEPYLRHPWEPALVVASRHERWRAELSGKYLTPSVRSVPGATPLDPEHHVTLWGTLADASLEARGLGLDWSAAGHNQQALGTDGPANLPGPRDHNFRRAWSAEAAVRRALARAVDAELRWLYTDRTETWDPPTGPRTLRGLDRVAQLETWWRATPTLTVRAGGLYDQITVAKTGATAVYSEGSRHESRAYFGLDARFGRVSVAGVEGIELDPEPYQVVWHHDKAFIKLQTTF
ncbi:MAG TPA: hypothetical protein VI792_05480, partial [Candidatus Eisenbacteria bacterium]